MSFKSLEDIINRDLDDFDEYSFLLETVFEQKQSKLSKKIDREINTDREYDEQEIIEFYLDDLNQVGAVFPSFFRKSLLISLYSLLENELKKLCEKIEFSLIEEQKYKEGNGNYVNNAKLYINSACQINSAFLGETWDIIDKYRRTRNILIHDGGRVYHDSDKYKKIEVFISTESETKYIEVTNSGYMFFEKEFVDLFMATIKNLFKELFLEINRKSELFQS